MTTIRQEIIKSASYRIRDRAMSVIRHNMGDKIMLADDDVFSAGVYTDSSTDMNSIIEDVVYGIRRHKKYYENMSDFAYTRLANAIIKDVDSKIFDNWLVLYFEGLKKYKEIVMAQTVDIQYLGYRIVFEENKTANYEIHKEERIVISDYKTLGAAKEWCFINNSLHNLKNKRIHVGNNLKFSVANGITAYGDITGFEVHITLENQPSANSYMKCEINAIPDINGVIDFDFHPYGMQDMDIRYFSDFMHLMQDAGCIIIELRKILKGANEASQDD